MKLLLDANLSWKLVKLIDTEFPGSSHVAKIGLGFSPSDSLIWKYALKNDYVIITQDEDFFQLSIQKGFPPQVILIQAGNLSTKQVLTLINNYEQQIKSFSDNQEFGILEIY